VWPDTYIAEVWISETVAQKILQKHNVSPDEVREAVVMCSLRRAKWQLRKPEMAWRLLVEGDTAAGRQLFVVLYPVSGQDGCWRLGTAFSRS